MVRFRLNGMEREFDGDPEMPVLWYLRDVLGLTGTKFVLWCGPLRLLYCALEWRRSSILHSSRG